MLGKDSLQDALNEKLILKKKAKSVRERTLNHLYRIYSMQITLSKYLAKTKKFEILFGVHL